MTKRVLVFAAFFIVSLVGVSSSSYAMGSIPLPPPRQQTISYDQVSSAYLYQLYQEKLKEEQASGVVPDGSEVEGSIPQFRDSGTTVEGSIPQFKTYQDGSIPQF